MSHSDTPASREDLLHQIDSGWNKLQTYLASLTEEQLTQPKDAAGWAAKDHVIHIAMWEKATLALLDGKSKREALDIPQAIWEQDDDPINAAIQQRYHDLPLNEALKMLHHHHDLLLKKLDTMTDVDLQLPYRHYQPQSTDENPLIAYLTWDTVYHYRDHLPWITAIVEQA